MKKIYSYAKDQYKAKCQFLINKRKSIDLKHFNDSKAFIEYSNDMNDIYKTIEEYIPNKKRKYYSFLMISLLICLVIKNLIQQVFELFIKGTKLKISLVFLIAVPKNIRLNSTHYSIMKIPYKRELQQIAFNHSSVIDFKGFMIFTKNVLQNRILF